jgi:predicted nucleotidyltransferase
MQDNNSQGFLPATITPVAGELRAHDAVLGLILSGSVAPGCARQFSYVDLCIVTKKNTMDAVRMELLSHGSKKIDVSIFSDLLVQIRFRTMKEGKILFFKLSHCTAFRLQRSGNIRILNRLSGGNVFMRRALLKDTVAGKIHGDRERKGNAPLSH